MIATTPNASLIATDEYPAMLNAEVAANFVRRLSLPETAQRAQRIIELRRDELCEAVLDYIQHLESAAATSDFTAIFDQAHEIRGLAATAGMEAAGRIADGLCRYLDAAKEQSTAIDPAVVALHVDAIVRASSSSLDAKKFGSRVAVELGALVARKLNNRA
jgi:chemotaxis protein histidine kinase CheA